MGNNLVYFDCYVIVPLALENNFIFEDYSGWIYDCNSFLGYWGITKFIFDCFVTVFWAIENNLVYFRGILVGSMILIVSWSHRWNAVNNLVYFRKDLIVINFYLLFSRW